MSFNARIYQEAERKLNERKQRNERLLEKREQEIAAKCPETAKLQRELSLTGARLIDLILNKDQDFEKKLSELEQNNILLQERLGESLVRSGYPKDYLDMPAECKLCGDTGIVEGKHCQCFKDIVRQIAAEELNRSSSLHLYSFSDFNLSYYDDSKKTAYGCSERESMENNLKTCQDYAENFHLPCNGIFMRGATGLGKTHLSLSIANEVIKKGYNVIYGSAPDLFRKMELEHFDKAEGDTAGVLQNAELLILDDLGAEFESKFYTSALYGILNNRMNSSLPVIVSTNFSLNELKDRYGERIMSRLMTMEQLVFFGRDIRIKKANSI